MESRLFMELPYNKSNVEKLVGDYLSFLQLKFDCETVYNLLFVLQRDGVTAFGILPYITLTTYAVLEFLEKNEHSIPNTVIPEAVKIKDVRMKLKIFEDGYSKSKKMLLNIDYLQDQIFRNQLKFNFTKNWNIHYNLGLYADKNNHVVGNTQYNYYLLQDNRFLKRSLADVALSYAASPNHFDLNEQVGKDSYDYSYACGQIIASAHFGLKEFDVPISILSKSYTMKYYYADYNTNVVSMLFPNGEEGKAMVLYLLHILSTINFLLYVLNNYEKDDYGWWLKINYITYYYSIHKLQDLQQHLIQNKCINLEITKFFKELDIDNAKYLNSAFRNYAMHSKLANKDGNILIDFEKVDKTKPLFGLVETCFNDLNYQDLKHSIVSEMVRISDILSRWLNINQLIFKPL